MEDEFQSEGDSEEENGDDGDPLVNASTTGDLEKVKLLLNYGFTIDIEDGGSTPLHGAATNGHLEVVKLLLEKGANINKHAGDYAQITPLAAAADEGHLGVVQLLVEKGARLDLVDESGYNALHYAILGGHAEVVKYLLPRFSHTERDQSPLCIAVENGNLEMVKLLLEIMQSVDVNAKSPEGSTLIFLAVQLGHVEIAKLLIQRGSCINAEAGFTPLLITATLSESLDMVKLLLANGANVDSTNNDLSTPLHSACYQGHLSVAQLLLDHGANYNAEDRIGRTPLFLASNFGYARVVQLLLDRGAKLDLSASSSRTNPLVAAALNGHLDVVKLLVAKGERSISWETALLLSAQSGYLDVVKFLLDNGVGAVAPPKNSGIHTPLDRAAENKHWDVVKLLVERGANSEFLSDRFCFPLSSAVQHSNFGMVKFLVEHGASQDLVSFGQALSASLKAGKLDVAELMIRTRPKIAAEIPQVLLQVVNCDFPEPFELLDFLVANGASVNCIVAKNGFSQTALHVAVMSKQRNKVWKVAFLGADPAICYHDSYEPKTAQQLCHGDKALVEALKHEWSPQTHKLHPKCTRDAITCALMVAKRQLWPLDNTLLFKIVQYIAYDWQHY